MGNWVESDAFSDLKEALRRISASLPETYAIELAVELHIVDTKHERSLTLLNTGLCTIGGREPFLGAETVRSTDTWLTESSAKCPTTFARTAGGIGTSS